MVIGFWEGPSEVRTQILINGFASALKGSPTLVYSVSWLSTVTAMICVTLAVVLYAVGTLYTTTCDPSRTFWTGSLVPSHRVMREPKATLPPPPCGGSPAWKLVGEMLSTK